uniref:Uncharacterized protein n=1 Tax=Romanomermis culicivorax TaxID=13658 RepID=A0A915I4Q9_ROMCU
MCKRQRPTIYENETGSRSDDRRPFFLRVVAEANAVAGHGRHVRIMSERWFDFFDRQLTEGTRVHQTDGSYAQMATPPSIPSFNRFSYVKCVRSDPSIPCSEHHPSVRSERNRRRASVCSLIDAPRPDDAAQIIAQIAPERTVIANTDQCRLGMGRIDFFGDSGSGSDPTGSRSFNKLKRGKKEKP